MQLTPHVTCVMCTITKYGMTAIQEVGQDGGGVFKLSEYFGAQDRKFIKEMFTHNSKAQNKCGRFCFSVLYTSTNLAQLTLKEGLNGREKTNLG